MATFGGSNTVTDGLVLWLDAANRKSYPGSGTSWLDLSGNNNTGTLTNGPAFSSANNGSIVFDGTNDYCITTALPLTGTEVNLTLSCWFRPSNVNTIRSIISIGDEQNGKRRMILQRNAQIEANGYNVDFTSTSNVLSTNTWCCIAIVYSSLTLSTGVKLYFNGIEINGTITVGTTLNAFTNTKCTICGNNATPPTENAQGNIALTQIYNRALSAQEVRQNYDALKSRYLNIY
jgi:hypothetical protein